MFKILPTEKETTQVRVTKDDLAKQLYKTYDVALPQDWVNACTALGYDPRSSFVWSYEPILSTGMNTFGAPGPLTEEAAKWLRDNDEKVWEQLRKWN